MLSIHSSPIGPLGTRDTGGMSVYVRELARWLGQYGHQVDIFTCASPDAVEAAMLYPNVRLINLAPNGPAEIGKEQLPLHLNAVFEALEAYRRKHALSYDLIHSHYWISGVVGVMAQVHWECPHLTMFHTLGMVKNSTASGEKEPDRRIAHEHRLARAVDMIVVPASREHENLVSLYNVETQKIRIIPCGVNLELFQPLKRSACRRQLGIGPDSAVALFVGRFAPLKGIDALMGAIADLKNKFDLQLVVVGGDGPEAPDTQSLTRLVKALGIQDRVTFAGRIDQKDLPVYYSACDLLVVPSHYESFGLVVLEAIACGTPVVSTAVGAVETIVQPGINGTVVDKPTRDRVARGIARILERPYDERKRPDTIRDTVSHCGWDRMAAEVIETYGELIRVRQNASSQRLTAGFYTFAN